MFKGKGLSSKKKETKKVPTGENKTASGKEPTGKKEESGGSKASGDIVTFEEFKEAVTTANPDENYPEPDQKKFEAFVSQLQDKGGITTKLEAAMFLTHVIWESGGLQFTEESICKGNTCPGAYPNKDQSNTTSYHGRGYLQLTWDYNYEEASKDLYGDNTLIEDPESVAGNEERSWETALWFWKKRVHQDPDVQNGMFGKTTDIINGGLECVEPGNIKAEKRFEIYGNILKVFGISEAPKKEGCQRW